jgi:hypothetical protein
MTPQSTFTAEELHQILVDIGLETNVVVENDDEGDMWIIYCELGSVRFRFILLSDPPNFDGALLFAMRTTSHNPFKFANAYNEVHQQAAVYIVTDSDGRPEVDEDGEFAIRLRLLIPFYGGVTSEYISFCASIWIEDLLDFYEIEDDDTERTSSEIPIPDDEVREMNLSQQIEWALGDSIPRTARELAERLMTTKHDINSALYQNRALFVKNDGQPPRWTLTDS